MSRIERTDTLSNPTTETPISELIEQRPSRRGLLKGAAAMGAVGLAGGGLAGCASTPRDQTIGFTEIKHALIEGHEVAPGYSTQTVIRWGDAMFPDAPAWNPRAQTAAAQIRQYGTDNDFLAFMPLPYGSQNSGHGILCSNHERTVGQLMFPGVTAQTVSQLTREQCEVQMASQGHDFVEIRKTGGRWQVVTDSRYNRRFTPWNADFRIGGPAAGHPRMRTSADPQGMTIRGTLNNCAGGKTPWGTVLSGEENLHNYFTGDATKGSEANAWRRYGITGRGSYVWGRYHDRFNLDKEPNETNRFGWVVEMDPYDPTSTPVKRTAIGRCKHEGATTAVSHDGRVAVYTGDDERMEYVYKFVTSGKFNPTNRAANRDLLDDGVLYVAKFNADGTMNWLPLVHGQGGLTAANGFNSPADVVIEVRRAADLVGATPMDRPEDVEPHPETGNIFVCLTYNERRTAQQVNPANPRDNNRYGHIIEIMPPVVSGKPDHTATTCRWDFFIQAGDSSKPEHRAKYGPGTTENGWLTCPDNVAFDPRGRVWIVTDGQDDTVGFSDSIYAAETAGPRRGATRLFFNAPRGSEVCGPEFTPDGRTLFVAIQHPAEEKDSTFDRPSTRWPDFRPDMPPRPAVLAITRNDGGEIGS
jgi:secreted PhoX family phosphatase